MKITIEEINGVPHTVIWYHNVITDASNDNFFELAGGVKILILNMEEIGGLHIATALPPLPRNPTVDETNKYRLVDAQLIDLYRAHGLRICCEAGSACLIDGKRDNRSYGTHEILAYHVSRKLFCFSDIESHSGDWGYAVYKIIYAINAQGNRIEIAIIDKENGERK